jgi:hypothetical protein
MLMIHGTSERPCAVVALGGNALLHRGEPLAARDAARILARASLTHQLVVTHGNGPQVGLPALMSDAYTETAPYPLDVLNAETAGQTGYVLEMQLDNYIQQQDTVTVITRVVVDGADPAFDSPTKFIGPLYTEAEASELADRHDWTVRPDGGPARGAAGCRGFLATRRSLARAAPDRAAGRDRAARRRGLRRRLRRWRRSARTSVIDSSPTSSAPWTTSARRTSVWRAAIASGRSSSSPKVSALSIGTMRSRTCSSARERAGTDATPRGQQPDRVTVVGHRVRRMRRLAEDVVDDVAQRLV